MNSFQTTLFFSIVPANKQTITGKRETPNKAIIEEKKPRLC